MKERMEHLKTKRETFCPCHLCERAAIIEHDGGVSRDEAELLAAEEQTGEMVGR